MPHISRKEYEALKNQGLLRPDNHRAKDASFDPPPWVFIAIFVCVGIILMG